MAKKATNKEVVTVQENVMTQEVHTTEETQEVVQEVVQEEEKNIDMTKTSPESIREASEYLELQAKKVSYEKWLKDFESLGDSEKATAKTFSIPSSKRKDKDGKKVFVPKATAKMPRFALDKTFEKNVVLTQVFFQNLRNSIDYANKTKKEEEYLAKDILTEDENKELQKLQAELEELKTAKTLFEETHGTPDIFEVKTDMLAFITAWCLNPEKGQEYSEKGSKSKYYDIHFDGMEKVTGKLIIYFNKWLDMEECEEKAKDRTELKTMLDDFCNKYMKKSFDIGYKNVKVRFNNEMLKLAVAYSYDGQNKNTTGKKFKDDYKIIQNVFRVALAYTFGIFEKEEVESSIGHKYNL